MLVRWLGLSLVIATISISVQQGCTDLRRSLTHWAYYPIRDMRQTIVIDPQRGDPLRDFRPAFFAPDSLAVPMSGQDLPAGDAPYDGVAFARYESPVPADDASVARGDSLFRNVCAPCHGRTMLGDGPVAAQFMPPPDLLAEPTRQRADGFLYLYMRHGGVVMPSYGNALTRRDAWDLVHYIRQQQRVSPR